MKNLAGQRFGKLVAVRPVGRKNRYVVWECQCDCGNTKDVAANLLTAGKTRSCGCLRAAPERQGRQHDLAGKRFGKLVAVERVGTKNRYALWSCQCDCGRTCDVSSRDLVGGRITDCGCESASARRAFVHPGQRFGELVAIDKADTLSDGTAVWRCVCDCNHVTYALAADLLSGSTTHCGGPDHA